jgi:hypothetical protein
LLSKIEKCPARYKLNTSQTDRVSNVMYGQREYKGRKVVIVTANTSSCSENTVDFVKTYGENLSNWCVSGLFDGTIIRVYWHDAWRCSTNNLIDAHKSFWGSDVSFGDLFDKIFEKSGLMSKLDKEYSYTFTLLKDSIAYCGTFKTISETGPDLVDSCEVDDIDIQKEIKTGKYPGIILPQDYEFGSVKDIMAKFEKEHILGFVLKNKTTFDRVIITNPEYCYMRVLKGNTINTELQICKLMSNPGSIVDLLGYYPQFKEMVARVSDIIECVAKEMYNQWKEAPKPAESLSTVSMAQIDHPNIDQLGFRVEIGKRIVENKQKETNKSPVDIIKAMLINEVSPKCYLGFYQCMDLAGVGTQEKK